MFDTVVSSMQKNDVAVQGNAITGTLKYLATGSPAETYGAGYFIALKWSNLDSDTTSLKVGIIPSRGTGLVECFDDLDRNGYFKVSDRKMRSEKEAASVLQHRDGSGNQISGGEIQISEDNFIPCLQNRTECRQYRFLHCVLRETS